jgi:hypothetical protein
VALQPQLGRYISKKTGLLYLGAVMKKGEDYEYSQYYPGTWSLNDIANSAGWHV